MRGRSEATPFFNKKKDKNFATCQGTTICPNYFNQSLKSIRIYVCASSRFVGPLSVRRRANAMREMAKLFFSGPPDVIALFGGIPNPRTVPVVRARFELDTGEELEIKVGGAVLYRELYSSSYGNTLRSGFVPSLPLAAVSVIRKFWSEIHQERRMRAPRYFTAPPPREFDAWECVHIKETLQISAGDQLLRIL